MPAVAGQDDGLAGLHVGKLRLRLLPDLGLDALAAPVELAQLGRERGGLRLVGAHQQAAGLEGLPQTPGGVEARREAEADGRGGEVLRVHAGLPQHGRKAGQRVFLQLSDAAAHQVAVLVHKGHHVRHRPDGNQIRVAFKHRFPVPVAGADELERDAHPGEAGIGVGLALELAVDHGHRVRQGAGLALMVVGDDHVHAEGTGVLGLLHGGDAAVDRDGERHALLAQRFHRAAVQPVALLPAVGDIGEAADAAPAEVIRHEAGGGDPVHVVIAVNGDRLAQADRLLDAGARDGHAAEQQGIVQAFGAALHETVRAARRREAAQRQHGREQRPVARFQQLRGDGRLTVWNCPFLPIHKRFHSFSL